MLKAAGGTNSCSGRTDKGSLHALQILLFESTDSSSSWTLQQARDALRTAQDYTSTRLQLYELMGPQSVFHAARSERAVNQ